MRLRIPFRNQPLREPDRDINRSLRVAVEINHRRFHPLQRDERALRAGIQNARRQAVLARLAPIINEFRKLRGFERIPRDQHAVGALHRRERAPFMGDVIFRRIVAGQDAPLRGRQNQGKKGCFHGSSLWPRGTKVVTCPSKVCKKVVRAFAPDFFR